MTNLDIETFWAVVHHGTMTAAAESLYWRRGWARRCSSAARGSGTSP